MKYFLISLLVQIAFSSSFAEKKKETPDVTPVEESCPSYGCEDSSDDGNRRGDDSVDGTNPGDDWWGGDRDGGGDSGPDFSYTVQNNLVTFVEFTCVIGGKSMEFSSYGNEPLEVELAGETVVIHRRENTFAGEYVMLLQRYDANGKLTNSIFKTWPKNEPLRFIYETTSHGQKDVCEVLIVPKRP